MYSCDNYIYYTTFPTETQDVQDVFEEKWPENTITHDIS